MPRYEYKCKNGHRSEISHAPGAVVVRYCGTCGLKLVRVFSSPNIRRSSFIEPSPAIKKFLDNTPQRRDEYLARKEARGE